MTGFAVRASARDLVYLGLASSRWFFIISTSSISHPLPRVKISGAQTAQQSTQRHVTVLLQLCYSAPRGVARGSQGPPGAPWGFQPGPAPGGGGFQPYPHASCVPAFQACAGYPLACGLQGFASSACKIYATHLACSLPMQDICQVSVGTWFAEARCIPPIWHVVCLCKMYARYLAPGWHAACM
jgi:hypothetical protein